MEIDATDEKGLTQERFKQFIDNVGDEDICIFKDCDSKILSCKKGCLIEEFFKSLPKDDVKEDDVYSFKASSAELKFSGKDLLWWVKTSKRLEKLEAIVEKKEQKKEEKKEEKEEAIQIQANEKRYSVGVATLVDNELTNIHHFEGSKQECIDFINNDMFGRYIDETLNSKIVINLAFDIDEFSKAFSDASSDEAKESYKKNLEMWYSLQELEEMGAISTK